MASNQDEDPDFGEANLELERFQNDAVLKAVLAQGVDLRQYSNEIEEQMHSTEAQCVAEFTKQSPKIDRIRTEIDVCDQMFERMHVTLQGFKAHLGAVSGEIHNLQDESLDIGVRLLNRKRAEVVLSRYLELVVIPPSLCQVIFNDEVSLAYVKALSDLHRRLAYAKRHTDTQAVQDVAPVLAALRLKATAKLRLFFYRRFESLRKPQTNIQIKQSVLVKYRRAFEFLLKNADDVALELKQTYISVMSNQYSALFERYFDSMVSLLATPIADSLDMLGTNELQTGGLFSYAKSSEQILRALRVGSRTAVLKEIEQDPLIFHVAQSLSVTLQFEFILRSAIRLLIDTATTEFEFLSEFFHPKERSSSPETSPTNHQLSSATPPVDIVQGLFALTFGLSLNSVLRRLEDHLFNCCDVIGVLLMIRVVQQHQQLMVRRRRKCLDDGFQRMLLLLWPRFKAIIDLHIGTLKDVHIHRSVSSALPSLSFSFTDMVLMTRPHTLSSRYAELAASLFRLNKEQLEEPVVLSLRRLRSEVERTLLRLAGEIPSPKLQVVFLINNYDHILLCLTERHMQSEESVRFEELLTSQIALYVEEELSERQNVPAASKAIADMIATLKHGEHMSTSTNDYFDDTLPAVISAFSQSCSDGIEQIHLNVVRLFGDSSALSASTASSSLSLDGSSNQARTSTASQVLKQVLTQLLLYYQRFHDLVKKYMQSGVAAGNADLAVTVRDMISFHTLMFEVKKFVNRT